MPFVLKIRAEINYKFHIKQYFASIYTEAEWICATSICSCQPHSEYKTVQEILAKLNKTKLVTIYIYIYRTSIHTQYSEFERQQKLSELPRTLNEWSSENAPSNLLSANRKLVFKTKFTRCLGPMRNCDCRT